MLRHIQHLRCMARKMGLSLSQLHGALSGAYDLGDRTLDAIALTYPDLDSYICEYHRERARRRITQPIS